MFQIIKLSEKDNIAVSPMDIPENVSIKVHNIKTQTKIPQGHKISIKEIKDGDEITANYNLYTYPKTGVGIQAF